MESGKNLILVGFMGSGKSATGLRLAQKMKWDFVDMDREIERITHMSVAELFRRYGEVRFRSEEKLLVGKLCARERLVIATGGGVLGQEENLRLLQQCGTLIYLEASPEEIFKRVSRKKNTRPLLKKGFSVDDIARLLEEREPVYKEAAVHVKTDGRDIEQIVDDILKRLNH